MKRLYNLDYLRGMAAFAIMLYHYLSWTYGEFLSDTFMGRLGIYGVSIFYILSGLTLFYVYHEKMLPSRSEIFEFIKKRVYRIFPLLWFVTIFSVIMAKEIPNINKLILNLTGLFGLLKWDSYYATGAWSIGNELVFYIFFPFFILFAKKSKLGLLITSLIIFGLYLYFAFNKLSTGQNLSVQWTNYVNPLNQVFLFLGGFLIGLFFQHVKLKNYIAILMIFIGVSIFVFFPVQGDLINLVTRFNRLVFTISCFLICCGVYKLSLELPSVVHNPLKLLGEASYSVYLLHPLVYAVTAFLNKKVFNFSGPVIITLSVICTLISSYIVYEYFEKFFMKMGKTKKQLVPQV